MSRITNAFIRNHFHWDTMSDVRWDMVRDSALAARRVLYNADKFPKADFDYLEKQDMECTCFLLSGPVHYII